MKKIDVKTKTIVKRTLFFSLLTLATLATSIPTLAACDGATEQYNKSIETYYYLEYPALLSFDSRCTYYDTNAGQKICRIRMRGVVYTPKPPPPGEVSPTKFPAIIVNHGSGANFEANNKSCEIANYFVPKGYIVFVPFRRGYGDDDLPYPPHLLSDKSTGVYMEDMVADFTSGNQTYHHATNCTTGDGGCYRAELFEQEARMEIADYAKKYLKNRLDIKKDAGGLPVLAIMGNSYGGAITVLANEISTVQNAAVGFSVASQQWSDDDCPPNDQTCGGAVQRRLLTAAGNAKRPAFYLQAKWDYDTRPTIDLAYAHANGGGDHTHGQRFMASIFPYPKPDIDPDTGVLDYQSVHTGFFGDPSRWGQEVLEFIRQYGVK
jgi:pimeloyl-ACP methyl ester carboxylesterase